MREDLDEMLDQAIKAYTAAEPSPKLSARILRQTQQEPAPQRNRWRLALAVALPLAATLALAFVFAGPMSLPKAPAPIALQPLPPSIAQPQETLATTTSKPAPVPTQRHAHTVQKPRSSARPLPPPYSKEELALLNFVQQHPKEAAEIAEAQKKNSAPLNPQPIAISQLEIKPLTIAPLN